MTLTRSIECPECKNDLWDMWSNIAECSNCGHKRPYHQRNARDDYVTLSQERAANRIKKYFDGSRFSRDGNPTTEITKWAPTLQKTTGIYYISIETGSSSIWTIDGGHFSIGRKGGIKVLLSYQLSTDRTATEKHIANMIGGKAQRWR